MALVGAQPPKGQHEWPRLGPGLFCTEAIAVICFFHSRAPNKYRHKSVKLEQTWLGGKEGEPVSLPRRRYWSAGAGAVERNTAQSVATAWYMPCGLYVHAPTQGLAAAPHCTGGREVCYLFFFLFICIFLRSRRELFSQIKKPEMVRTPLFRFRQLHPWYHHQSICCVKSRPWRYQQAVLICVFLPVVQITFPLSAPTLLARAWGLRPRPWAQSQL
jgi:hypothetical protein